MQRKINIYGADLKSFKAEEDFSSVGFDEIWIVWKCLSSAFQLMKVKSLIKPYLFIPIILFATHVFVLSSLFHLFIWVIKVLLWH